MRHLPARLAFALLLVVASLAGTSVSSVHSAGAPSSIWFPWVPKGEMIGGQGPWIGQLSFQNLSDDSCGLAVFVGLQGSWHQKAQISLIAGASRTVSSSSLAIPSPGAPVRLEASCQIAASLKTFTPDASYAPWSDGAAIVSGYTGIGQADLAAGQATASSAWYLPIVQTNSDWNTFIRIANLDLDDAVDAQVDFYPIGNELGADGSVLTLTRRIGTGSVWTIDSLFELAQSEWVGFVRVTTSGDVGIVAQRTKASTQMAITNVAIAADSLAEVGTQRLAAPLLFNAYNGWNTGINLANVANEMATVTLEYHVAGGELVKTESLTIPGRSMTYVYTPGNVAEEGFVGSATIISDQPLVAAIDEVKYETTESLSYMASCRSQNDAALPIVFREDPANSRHDNSGINIVNLSPDSEQTVTIELRTTTGQQLLDVPYSLTLPPGGNAFAYLPFIEGVPPGTLASARLLSQNPAGFVAISNDINYTVDADGSVVFVASSQDGYYLVPETTAP